MPIETNLLDKIWEGYISENSSTNTLLRYERANSQFGSIQDPNACIRILNQFQDEHEPATLYGAIIGAINAYNRLAYFNINSPSSFATSLFNWRNTIRNGQEPYPALVQKINEFIIILHNRVIHRETNNIPSFFSRFGR